MRYIPHTSDEIQTMLKRIGVSSIDELFESIPESHRCTGGLDLPPGVDEATLMKRLADLGQKNDTSKASFAGAGMYQHHIPPAVDQLLLRSEFYTAYTPYQGEVAQGTLQSVFEFQTMICEVLGMEVANASMYCGASATAEAALMARRITKRKHLVVSEGVHPQYIETIRTYLSGLDNDDPSLTTVPITKNGHTDVDALNAAVTESTAAVIMGYPNLFGCIEDLSVARETANRSSSLLITCTSEPYALGVVRPPGDFGADIAVGEGQAFATAPNYGGPGLGLFATLEKNVRQMPGRLVGQTTDADGNPGYVLTLSTREQHIRRERATSNICTNHNLIALAAAIRLALLGRSGFVQIAEQCLAKAAYLKAQIAALPEFEVPHDGPHFNEFVIRHKTKSADEILGVFATHDILGGISMTRLFPEAESGVLVAVTELHSRDTLDEYLKVLRCL